MKIEFDIYHPGEIDAGIHGYTDLVSIYVESGDPGGEKGEFAEFMKDALTEWFDGAGVDQT